MSILRMILLILVILLLSLSSIIIWSSLLSSTLILHSCSSLRTCALIYVDTLCLIKLGLIALVFFFFWFIFIYIILLKFLSPFHFFIFRAIIFLKPLFLTSCTLSCSCISSCCLLLLLLLLLSSLLTCWVWWLRTVTRWELIVHSIISKIFCMNSHKNIIVAINSKGSYFQILKAIIVPKNH